jgi:hypothetical protein
MAIQYMGIDPFRDCADPGSAIPSAACERALAALEQAIVAQCNPIVLMGPIGAGKTLLLRRIAKRPPPYIRTVFLPWLNVSGEDLIPWIRGFEDTQGGEDFVAAARTFFAQGLRTLLLVDEAQGMTRDSAGCLAELAGRAQGAVQVLLAGTDRPSLHAAATAFPGGAVYVELAGELTPEEVARWAVHALGTDRSALPKDLDWAELVQKAEGVPRLVRWELERRLATGDLAAALARQAVPKVAGLESTRAVNSKVAPELPAPRALAEPSREERSTHPSFAVELEASANFFGRLRDGLRGFARWCGEVCAEVGGAAWRQALVIRRAIPRWLRQRGHAIASRTESLGGLVIAREEGFSARSTAALRNTQVWYAQYSNELLRRGREIRLAIAEALRRFEPKLRQGASSLWELAKESALAAIHLAARAAAAARAEIRRAAHPEPAGETPLPFLPLEPLPKRAHAFVQAPGLRAGSLAVLAIVAAVAFVLGRVTALPEASQTPRGFTPIRPPPVLSGPAAAPQLGRGNVAPPGSVAGPLHEPQETNPSASQPHPNALHPAPPAHKHVLVMIDAHPRARIWIDGHEVGSTPLVHVHLKPGRHNFLVVFADGRRINRTLEIHHSRIVNFS